MDIIARDIYQDQLGQIRKVSPKAADSDKPECVHDLRVAVLRLEAAIGLFSKWIPLDEETLDQLKSVRKTMGPVRDLDVLLKRLQVNLRNPEVIQTVGNKHAGNRQKLVRELKSGRYAQLMKALQEVCVPGMPLKKSFMSKKVVKASKKVFQWHKKLKKSNKYHQLRTACKKLRYTCEFFSQAFPKTLRRQIKASKKIQDILGDHQDAVAALETIRGLKVKDRRGIDEFLAAQKQVIKTREKQFTSRWKKSHTVLMLS